MNATNRDKITIELPVEIYKELSHQACEKKLTVIDFLSIKTSSRSSKHLKALAQLSLRELFAKTRPREAFDRLDFFS